MRRVIILALAVLLLLAIAAPATADSDNWEPDKQYQVALNRCANAGAGNGGEFFIFTHHFQKCLDKFDFVPEYFYIWIFKINDADPGNSPAHNNAPAVPPGQAD